jgi:hypothetical protein
VSHFPQINIWELKLEMIAETNLRLLVILVAFYRKLEYTDRSEKNSEKFDLMTILSGVDG